MIRERASTARDFDPAEIGNGAAAAEHPAIWRAALPLVVAVAVNISMSMIVLPRIDASFFALPEWGATSLAGVGGV